VLTPPFFLLLGSLFERNFPLIVLFPSPPCGPVAHPFPRIPLIFVCPFPLSHDFATSFSPPPAPPFGFDQPLPLLMQWTVTPLFFFFFFALASFLFFEPWCTCFAFPTSNRDFLLFGRWTPYRPPSMGHPFSILVFFVCPFPFPCAFLPLAWIASFKESQSSFFYYLFFFLSPPLFLVRVRTHSPVEVHTTSPTNSLI